MAEKRTEIGQLGEFGLIDHLTKNIELVQENTLLGVGDDAAILKFNQDCVISTDLLVEGIHFDLSYTPLKHLGYKAIAVNVSDIAAMYATPKQVLVSLAVSNRFSVEALDEIYLGIQLACKNYAVDLVGGDTTSSTAGLVISVTCLGDVENKTAVKRSGAKIGDLVYVSGDLGAAFMGLQLLEREKEVLKGADGLQPELDDKQYLLRRLLRPEARTDVIYQLKEHLLRPTSMMDVSDGLASELNHIARNSKVGFEIYDEYLPIDEQTYHTALEFNLDPTVCALNGGEDYELLMTFDPSDRKKLDRIPELTQIGEVVEASKGITLITKSSQRVPIRAQGWVHFNPT
jgi:thiamine-monophosphate kinase